MEDTDAIVRVHDVRVLRSFSKVYRCRDDVSGQEETERLHMGKTVYQIQTHASDTDASRVDTCSIPG